MIVTMLIGIAGVFVCGFVSSLIGFGSVTGFDFRGILIALAAQFYALNISSVKKVAGFDVLWYLHVGLSWQAIDMNNFKYLKYERRSYGNS
jgi:hypothetical protein